MILHLHVFKEPPDVRQELCSRLIRRMKSQTLRDQLQVGPNRTTLQENTSAPSSSLLRLQLVLLKLRLLTCHTAEQL